MQYGYLNTNVEQQYTSAVVPCKYTTYRVFMTCSTIAGLVVMW